MYEAMVESTMLSSGTAHWTVLVMFFLCSKGVYTVTITVSPTVVTEENTADVILPCKAVMEKPNEIYNMRWDMGGETVITKDTINQIFYGDKYTGRVNWGDGCSLILFNPCLNDTGRYGFTILAPKDQNISATAKVELKVTEARIKETTSNVSSVPQSTGPTSANKPTQDRHTSPAWEHFIPMTVVSMLTVISLILFMRYMKRQGHIDAQDKVYLGILIVFCVSGFVTIVVSLAVRNTIVLVVSGIAVTLGLVIQCVYVYVYHIKLTKESTTKKLEEEQKGKCLGSTQIDL